MNVSGLKYVRVLDIRKYDKLPNMRRNEAIKEEFWIFQTSKYAGFLHIEALHKVLNMPDYGVNNAIWQGSEYVWSAFRMVSDKPPVLNMPWLRIWHGCVYARLQGAEYAWISLNIP